MTVQHLIVISANSRILRICVVPEPLGLRTVHFFGVHVKMEDDEDTKVYIVVVNHEEQYSFWPSHRVLPRGWRFGGKKGSKAECLQYIEEVWTDMRPLSLRRKMDGNSDCGSC